MIGAVVLLFAAASTALGYIVGGLIGADKAHERQLKDIKNSF